MGKEVFQIGDVVQLKAEDKFKMTITEIYAPGEYRVCWLLKNGKSMHSVFSAEALKKFEK